MKKKAERSGFEKVRNPNHPEKGDSIRVDPIRRLEDVKAIKELLSDRPRDLLLFTIGVNNGLRVGDLLRLKVKDVRHLKEGDSIIIREKKTKTLLTNDEASLKEYPLVEKIKRAVLESPISGIRGVQKKLKTEKFGFVRIGWFRLRSILKTLNLETKEKRYRYYRSR